MRKIEINNGIHTEIIYESSNRKHLNESTLNNTIESIFQNIKDSIPEEMQTYEVYEFILNESLNRVKYKKLKMNELEIKKIQSVFQETQTVKDSLENIKLLKEIIINSKIVL